MFRMLYFYPIVLTLIGVMIHTLGIFHISFGDAPLWLHVLMLTVDILVVLGLILKSNWGYWFAVGLYVQQVTFQGYWAVQCAINHWDMAWLQWVTVFLCGVCLAILLWGKTRPLFVITYGKFKSV